MTGTSENDTQRENGVLHQGRESSGAKAEWPSPSRVSALLWCPSPSTSFASSASRPTKGCECSPGQLQTARDGLTPGCLARPSLEARPRERVPVPRPSVGLESNRLTKTRLGSTRYSAPSRHAPRMASCTRNGRETLRVPAPRTVLDPDCSGSRFGLVARNGRPPRGPHR